MRNNEILNLLKLMDNSGIKEFLQDHPRIFYNSNNHKIKEDFLNLNDVKTLEELRELINNFDKCELKKSAKNTVFSAKRLIGRKFSESKNEIKDLKETLIC